MSAYNLASGIGQNRTMIQVTRLISLSLISFLFFFIFNVSVKFDNPITFGILDFEHVKK